ncbi:lytic transglycosylase domain-containing protein [Clostridium gasigenes]|uniref:Lytic transglycosylase domain-containing protein n=1 Tax=Clostridium gasigenes TaxID=94869 RepID=A0A7X0SC75_9CLOT|nr:lytic transglycosylase domain-containing protein [Clostridium gasigenes]MBB6713693.1 lytic transglycosylase domain-containing protein [Clostridium gasigenes]MBU3102607.1 lytic transglycosylase domain-containing protein [Clostridium gasigenes]MBU3106330.1 lytic transglycosylase domain-containing protein [Clostridium gasigenes]MBU3131218.1 lytic transglycosylase domain-containing protein [Clostridium gasigenes]MBU3134738.1 lytic transglycosylase domain-containing protein [Clostridium gasigene
MKFRRILIILIALVITYFSLTFIMKEYVFPYKYSEYVDKFSEEYDIDPLLVLSVIKTESDFKEDALSIREAKGLMQIMDKTGEWAGKEIGMNYFLPNMLFDPKINIRMGCWYLANLESEFTDLDLVIAAYNGGSGHVKEWLENKEYSKDGKKLDYIPFPETKKYVDKVKTNYSIYKYLYSKD